MRVCINAANIKSWFDKGLLTKDSWQNVHVAIQGAHMARTGSLVVQTMSYLMGGEGEPRVIYAEGDDAQEAMTLVGTHIVDLGAGVAFFNDGMRLHRDLLADATADIIASMGPSPAPPVTDVIGSYGAHSLVGGMCPFAGMHAGGSRKRPHA